MRFRSMRAAGAVAILLTACAPKDRAASSSDTAAPIAATPGGTPVTQAAATGGAAAPNEVVVHARDFAYDAPASIPAGMTTFRLVNDGPAIHHLTIVRIDSGKTLADLETALKSKGPPPRWMVPVGGPNAPDPKGEANATLDMTPGTYALICFVDMPDGVPHFMKGMLRELRVTPATAATVAAAPAATTVVTLKDYEFDLSRPLAAGRQTFEVRTAPGQPHEVELIKLAPGKTIDDMMKWAAKPAGPPPMSLVGGVAGMAAGEPNYFTADISSGNYALICFLPDAKDGKPHFMHGMSKTITVS